MTLSRLGGKKILVTAAAQGIGRATALRFANEGAEVIASDVNGEALQALANRSGIRTEILDVLQREAVFALAKSIGQIDVLFNGAGYVHGGSILASTDTEWDFAMQLNVKSMFWTIQAFLPGMLEKKSGSIINISSVVSSVKGVKNRLIYGTTKAAVIGLTKAVAADFVEQGIRCNAICPGTIDTPSLHGRINQAADPQAALTDFIRRQPMGRLGLPEEVAALAAYLASDEAKFVTGTTQIIDGGFSL